MGQWSTRACGLWHDSSTPVSATNLQGMDFLISKIGSNFVQNDCNIAHNLNIPFGLFFESDPEVYQYYPLDDYTRWPKGDGEPTTKMLDQYIFMGGMVKRAVHFIVIDCSKTIDSLGNTFPSGWITAVGRRMATVCWERYKLPIYIYMNQNPIVSAITQVDRDKLVSFLTEYGDGQSTYTKAVVGADGFPADGLRPKLAYDGGKPWGFWLYNPVAGGIKTIFYKDKTGLYADLDYKASGEVVVPPPTPVDDDIPSTGMTASLEEKLSILENKINDVHADITSVYTYLTTHIK